MDSITSDRILLLHPAIIDAVREAVDFSNRVISEHITIRIVQGYRSFQEQNILFAQGRTKPGKIVTKARAGQSFHNYGLALDFCFLVDGKELSWDTEKDFDYDRIPDWHEVVNVFEKEGFEWGGSWKTFKDYPHLQKTFNYEVRDLFIKFSNHDFIPGTNYVNL